MIVTFPHMGEMYIPIKVLLDTSDIDYIIPPYRKKESLEAGVMHSPEFACLPFKTILGDFIYGVENGANFILFGGGCGQCRLGYFGDLQSEILRSLNYRINFVCVDLSNLSIKEVLKKIQPLTKGKNKLKIVKGIIYAIKTVYMIDNLSKLSRYTRCRETNKGDTDRIISNLHENIQNEKCYRAIKLLIKSARKKIKKIPLDKARRPIKISIVGEMYVAAHPYINFEIEKKLGNMGVEVYNNLCISNWITEHLIKKMLPFKLKNKPIEAGKEFIRTDDIGGHGMHTIGWSALSGKRNIDGVIHIFPFTCLPEVIAQCTFSEIQKKYSIPIMSLIIDEMTGEAGYITRLEAFVDMLEQKKLIKYTPS
ncbi:UNVERIFIED_CONTAM: putative nucleotide-binding protein (sugar kinase/HSP70/actin superfamily) [Acetivibrio alkalicellulosi]